MKLGSLTLSVGVLFALVATFFLYGECQLDTGEKRGEARAQARVTDKRVAELVAGQVATEARARRVADSLSSVIRRLRGRVDTLVVQDSTLPPSVIEQFVLRDSVIAALEAQHVQDSTQIVFWRTTALSYRDSIVPALQRQRTAFEKQARPNIFTRAQQALPFAALAVVLWEAAR